MADRRDYMYKEKSRSRNYRRDSTDKSKVHKSHGYDHRKHRKESGTPPLPTKTESSIEELLKRRERLKKELKKIVKTSDHTSVNKKTSDIRKHKHSSYNDKVQRSSYSYKKMKTKAESPSLNDNLSDSEDEENIIEQRRKQRKQLLEQLKASHKEDKRTDTPTTCDINDRIISINTDSHNDNPINKDVIKVSDKETTDMFSEADNFISIPDCVTQDSNENGQLLDNWDNSEGYYNYRIGEIINNNRYTIKSILGQGVFANVVRAIDKNQGNTEVAIKIIRNNDLMYQKGLKEIATLKEINSSDPENKYHCIKLLCYFMHKGHLCIVLEALHMDLRSVIKKYGKDGLNLKAIISYSRQMFLALRLLKKIGVIHADIKPDNILVNENKSILKLCDFGSAGKANDNEPTPYLVSRFYRAPEIILGLSYSYSVDIWSTACTIYEMTTGKIMFAGSSNNKMLKYFMDLKGKIPNRLIRKGKFKDQHFNYNHNFLFHKKDEVTGREKNVEISNINIVRDLEKDLKKSYPKLKTNEEKKLMHLKDLLDKMLMLDPRQRISNVDCLKHQFIQDDLRI